MRRSGVRRRASESGFTMVELVVVLAITGIVAGFATGLISQPMLAYQDVARRAELVGAAETALRRMARDVRRALPNSMRIAGTGSALELMHVADGVRYRAKAGTNPTTTENHSAASDRLSPGSDTSFNVLGRFGALSFTYATPMAAGHRVAVYPTGAGVWTDAATSADPGAITPAATTITIQDDVDEDQIVLSSSHRFSLLSPQSRLYVVDEPVTYLCDTGAGTLTRYWGYSMTSAQPTDGSASPLTGGSSALLSTRVGACDFSYQAGTSQRAGLATLSLTLAIGAEQVRLLHQVHVVNVP